MRYAHRRIVTRVSAVLVSASVVLFSGDGGPARAEDARAMSPAPVAGPAAASVGVSAAAWDSMRAAIERDQYGLRRSGEAYVATNHRHRLQVTFGQAAVDVRPREGDGTWRWGLRLAGYGYGDRREQLVEASRVVDGNRIEYRRGALVEWYVNERRGLEQGFTLAKPPAGRRAGVPLVVHLTATGTLRPKVGADGRGMEWRDARGTRTLWYRGLVVVDAEGRTLPSRMEVDGAKLRLRVEDEGATYPLTIDPFIELAKLMASDAISGDRFGESVAISGDTAIVGARLKGGVSAFSGAAYIFERNQGGVNNWGQVTKLTASDAAAADLFGTGVAIDGDTAVVGAPWNDDAGGNSGSAYIFERHQGGPNAWGEVTKLVASDAFSGDQFGFSVAISGDAVLIGANEKANGVGAAYIFERHHEGANAWGQVAKLTASDGTRGDHFGESVGISGDAAIVGAKWKALAAGTAYVFERHQGGPNAWGEVVKLTAGDAAAGDEFGESVAISGDTAIVGAWLKNGVVVLSGAAYIFERNQGGLNSWGQLAKLTASDARGADLFGSAVAISGDVALVGAEWDDINPTANDLIGNAGSAYIFERNQGGANAWGEVVKLTASDAALEDNFGHSVAISGERAFIGAYLDDDAGAGSGSAYVFGAGGDETSPVLALPNEVTVEATSASGAEINYIASAEDDVDGVIEPECNPPPGATFAIGTTTVTCTATDSAGNSSTGEFPVTVQDTTAPVIACGAPATITPPMAPVAFTATATDAVSTPTTVVTSYSCTAVNGSGRVVDKTESCVVELSGGTVQILDSGGVGDHISWTVTSTDEAGNASEAVCAVDVVNPGGGGR